MHVTYADVARHPIWATGRVFADGNAGGACLAPVPQYETPVPTMRML